MNKTLKNIMVVMMALSLVATGLLGVSRAGAERQAKTVDLVLDYEEFYEMARQSETSFEDWMRFFAEQGLRHVALSEETLKSLKAQSLALNYETRRAFLSRSHWDRDLPQTLVSALSGDLSDDYDLIVETSDPKLAAFIEKGLSTRIGSAYYKKYSQNETTWFVLDGTIEQALYETGRILTGADGKVAERPDVFTGSMLERIGIGFDPEKIDRIRRGGLEPLPRPINNPLNPELALEAFEADFKAYGFKAGYVIYSGPDVIGYDAEDVMSLDRLIQTLERLGLATSLIEAGNQLGHVETRGGNYVAENSHYNAVRVFPVVRYIQKRIGFYNYTGSEEIENTLYRAITERNLRSIYLRPFLENDRVYLTDQSEYARMLNSLKQRLEPHGLAFGEAGVMGFNAPGLFLKWISSIGLVVVGVWLLAQLFKVGLKLGGGLLLLGSAASAGALMVAPNLSTTLLGLTASLLFPAASVFILVQGLKVIHTQSEDLKLKTLIIKGMSLLIATFAISLAGGFYVGGFLSSSAYLLEMEYFRGVKLSLAAPVAAAALFYILRFGYGREGSELALDAQNSQAYWKDLLRLLEASIKVKHVALLGAGAVVAYVYIARSGHETELQPSNLEMVLRNTLEQILLARPRTKEFLMAFPAVMAAVVMASRKRLALMFPLLLVAALGYSSIVNTFSHLRTPLYLSAVRELYALGFGLVLGAVAAAAVWFLDRWLLEGLYAKWQRSREHEQNQS